MTVIRAILLSLILPVGLTILFLVTNRWKEADFFVVLLLIVMWAVGFLLGLFMAVIFKKPRWEPYYLGGQLMVILPLVVSFLYTSYKDAVHQKKFGNIEANADFVEFLQHGDYQYQVRIAVDSLTLKYKPNEFRLTGVNTTESDSSLNGVTEPVYFIEFHYWIVPTTQLKSLFRVYRNEASTIYYGRSMEQADYEGVDSFETRVMRNLEEAVKIMPDSIREKLSESLQE